LESKERIPTAYEIGEPGDGRLYNFWQDDTHVQGIWRSCTLASYRTEAPEWTTALDLDALPPPTAGTASTWVWHGSTLLDDGNHDRCLISLSPGGSDADCAREFDLAKNAFVENGFEMSEPAKSDVGWRSRDELLVGTDYGPDSMTDSGYPRVVKSWTRGTPLSDARVVFEGKKTDVAASMYAYEDRGSYHEFQRRSLTFYTSATWYRSPKDIKTLSAADDDTPFVRVPIPDDASLGTFGKTALVTLRSEWTVGGATYTSGAMLSLDLKKCVAGDFSDVSVLFEPTPSRSLEAATETKDFLILKVLEDVKATLVVFRYEDGAWEARADSPEVPVGEDLVVSAVNRDSSASNAVWVSSDGFLKVDSLDLADASSLGTREVVKTKPAMFDAAGLTVDQHFATSADGTRVPYFVLRKGDLPLDGSTPTLVDAYGGFEISLTPSYSAGVGIGWLERGGCKVVANVRGGGEYGPRWHQAALKKNRFKSYEDVEAVAQDLIDRKISSPSKLAVIGGSNGGLMVGNCLTRPIAASLFSTAVCQVPLLDMKRYSHLLAGASWMAEYGDPDTEDWSYLRNHSPYQRLRHDCLGLPEDGEASSTPMPGWRCPKVLFTTSTRDDRVHPGHARKMVKALLDEAGTDKAPVVEYWENVEGGHGGAADQKQRAFMWSLTYAFLAKHLGLDA